MSVGGLKLTEVSRPLGLLALVPVGGPGAVVVTANAIDAVEAAESPTGFVAITEHVYERPFVSPMTVIGDVVPEAPRVAPPSVDEQLAVKFAMAEPPFDPGTAK